MDPFSRIRAHFEKTNPRAVREAWIHFTQNCLALEGKEPRSERELNTLYNLVVADWKKPKASAKAKKKKEPYVAGSMSNREWCITRGKTKNIKFKCVKKDQGCGLPGSISYIVYSQVLGYSEWYEYATGNTGAEAWRKTAELLGRRG